MTDIHLPDPDERFSMRNGPVRIVVRDGEWLDKTIPAPPHRPFTRSMDPVGRPNSGVRAAIAAGLTARRDAKLARYAKLREALEQGMSIAAAAMLSGVPEGTARGLRTIWGLKTPCSGCGKKRHSGRCGGGRCAG